MHPYLTVEGRWLFITGICFSLVGAMAGEPFLVLLGQVPVVILTLAFLLVLPGARALDRRTCRLKVDSGEKASGGLRILRRGGAEGLMLWFENHSRQGLRIEGLRPLVRGALQVEKSGGELRVGPLEKRSFEVQVTSRGIGRGSLQGFDLYLKDRWGLVEIRDYLPCLQVFETYPSLSVEERLQLGKRKPEQMRVGTLSEKRSPSGTELRELREFQPGDPLRTIAWKATIRQRRLISREFDEERSRVEYLALDISSSMRAGTPLGVKFDAALELTARLASDFLREGAVVGLWSFDHEIYGAVEPATGKGHYRRVQRHLVGLNSVVEAGRTALDEEGVEEALADYLRIQERLDFRRSRNGAVDSELLGRWLASVERREALLWDQGGRNRGGSAEEKSKAREFFRRRGIPLTPPSEVRAGAKAAGLREVLRETLSRGRREGRLTLITDLCGLTDLGLLERPLHVASRRGLKVRVIAPFTPWYGAGGSREGLHEGSSEEEVLRSLFAGAEGKDRRETASQLEALGVEVQFLGPRLSS